MLSWAQMPGVPDGSFSSIVCVDWGKEHRKRRAWLAGVAERTIRPLPISHPSLGAILELAGRRSGRTLVAVDAVLGVPRTYLDRARAAVPAWREASDFLSWLLAAQTVDGFQIEARRASDWSPDRPFIAVPRGKGALSNFWAAAGGRLLREVDVATHAKSVFIVSGIPGTVGGGTRALWQELVPMLKAERTFGIWPFDGTLAALEWRPVVLAEIYPRVCCGLALAPAVPTPLKTLAKTDRAIRATYVDRLASADWVRAGAVRFEATARAVDDEDDFDAMFSAAALLRCVLRGHPLDRLPLDPVEGGILAAEGSILGLASIDFSARPRARRRRP